jgi:hypothetical protein
MSPKVAEAEWKTRKQRIDPKLEHDGTLLTDDLEIHTIELPKLAHTGNVEPREKPAYDWARFLAAETDEERRGVAMDNPDIRKANEALGRLSEDPKARLLARWCEDELRLQRVELKTAESRAREQGREETARAIARRQLEIKFGPLSEAARQCLDAANLQMLECFADRLVTARSVEEVLGLARPSG